MKKIGLITLAFGLFLIMSTMKVSAFSHPVETLNEFDNMAIFEELSADVLLAGDKIIQLSLGSSHSAALTESGRVFTWGFNLYGQLGDNTTTSRMVPTEITSHFPTSDRVIKLAMGNSHSAALTESGNVLFWGLNISGQLGDNTIITRYVPTDITHAFPEDDKVIQLSLGATYSGALTESGKVYTWGQNSYGQLGDGTYTYKQSPDDITHVFPVGDKVIQLALAGIHTAALTESGKVFTWGFNHHGQLGDGTNVSKQSPVDITNGFPAGDKVIQVSIGLGHTAALTESGKVFTWGSNASGQLGDNTLSNRWLPTNITNAFPAGDKVIRLSLSGIMSGALTEGAKVFTWGYGEYGQIGDNTAWSKTTPTDITSRFPAGDKVLELSHGGNHVAAVTESGEGFIWGYNDRGQLGDNTNLRSRVPMLLNLDLTPPSRRISFNANGGSAVANIEAIEGTSITAPIAPTKTNHTFSGWFSDSALTQAYTFNTMPGEDITLYAKWTINVYTITFDSQGGPAVDAITQDIDTVAIAPVEPTRGGYTFSGWFSDSALTQAYTFTTMPGEDITLYAKWTPHSYTITFDSNGGSTVDAITQDINTAVIAPTDPTKVGYTFNGWLPLVPTHMPAENITLTAQWTINAYTIRFSTQGGSDVKPLTQQYDTIIVEPLNPTKAGYEFDGWYSNRIMTRSYTFTTMPADYIILYAKWNIVSYTLTYELNDGTNHGDNPGNYTIETPTVTLSDPTRTGYTFSGWYLNADFTGSTVSDIPLGSTGDIPLYAKWTINSYTISFDSQGGSSVDDITQNYNTTVTAPANPTRVGYTFNGWSPLIPTKMPAENITLTAQWTINSYTITFDSNGGSSVDDITQNYNTTVTALADPTRVGYTFNGWSTVVPTHMPAENITIVARWLKHPAPTSDVLGICVEELIKGLTDSIHDNEDIELIMNMQPKDRADLTESDEALMSEHVTRRHQALIFDLSVVLKQQGEERVVEQLSESLVITLSIPLEDQGHKSYQVMRLRNGQMELVESVYCPDTHTLTFETDVLSTHMILYGLNGSTLGWWFIPIAISIGYLGYRYQVPILEKIKHLRTVLQRPKKQA